MREEEEERVYDPLMQGNIPTAEGKLTFDDRDVQLLRIPCPVMQEFINHAYIDEEFKTYLFACAHQKEKSHHLIINFQDRTSWKEHARCAALEELGRKAEFADVLTVATLAKDTDFYNQMGNYHDVHQAKEFIHHFVEHLSDESTGYAFPIKVKKVLFPTFVDQLLETIHRVFFDQKATLSVRERMSFIELAYQFITLKMIEVVHPQFLSLVSKDSLDVEAVSIVGLCALLGIGEGVQWKEEDFDNIITIFFGPTLINRERAVHPERFERLLDVIHLLENKKGYLDEFASLYEKTTLKAQPLLKAR